MQKGYDYSISFMRVCAMLFIMICHLGSHFKLTAIGIYLLSSEFARAKFYFL